MKRLHGLLVIALLNLPAHAQDSSKTWHIMALQFGMNQIKEENLHPKVSTGTITGLGYGFEKMKNNWQQFHFTLGYSRLKTQLEDLSRSVNLELNLSYSRTYTLIKKNEFSYYLGPEITLAYDGSYYPNWDDSHLYWADFLSIGARNNFSVEFGNYTSWISSVSVPLFSVFSRPELYRLDKMDNTSFGGIVSEFNSNITAAHLTNVFFLNVQTEYRFAVFKNKKEAFTYSFDWRRVKHDDGNPFNQIAHQIGIKLFL